MRGTIILLTSFLIASFTASLFAQRLDAADRTLHGIRSAIVEVVVDPSIRSQIDPRQLEAAVIGHFEKSGFRSGLYTKVEKQLQWKFGAARVEVYVKGQQVSGQKQQVSQETSAVRETTKQYVASIEIAVLQDILLVRNPELKKENVRTWLDTRLFLFDSGSQKPYEIAGSMIRSLVADIRKANPQPNPLDPFFPGRSLPEVKKASAEIEKK